MAPNGNATRTATSARMLGWSLTAVCYVCGYLLWVISGSEPPGMTFVTFACLAVSLVAIIAQAVRHKCPDLWAAGLLALIAPLMIPVWWAPFFAGP